MKKSVVISVIVLFIIIFIITLLICTVSNQKVQLMEGTPVLLTKELNVKPSPLAPVYSFTTENAAAVPRPGAEIQATKSLSIPVQQTKLPPGNIESTYVLKTDLPAPSYTIEPTLKLAPNVAAPATQTTYEYEAIAPTRVVKPSASSPFTAPSTNLKPPKE